MNIEEFRKLMAEHPGRTALQCAARGCDGCNVCEPVQGMTKTDGLQRSTIERQVDRLMERQMRVSKNTTDLILRDITESEPFDYLHADAVCISYRELEDIVTRHIHELMALPKHLLGN